MSRKISFLPNPEKGPTTLSDRFKRLSDRRVSVESQKEKRKETTIQLQKDARFDSQMNNRLTPKPATTAIQSRLGPPLMKHRLGPKPGPKPPIIFTFKDGGGLIRHDGSIRTDVSKSSNAPYESRGRGRDVERDYGRGNGYGDIHGRGRGRGRGGFNRSDGNGLQKGVSKDELDADMDSFQLHNNPEAAQQKLDRELDEYLKKKTV